MSKFREGNCVEVVIEPVDGNENIKVGDTGQVVDIIEGYIGVEFDRDISGHDCESMGKKGHCHYFDERTELDYLKLIYDMELVDELLDRMDEEFKDYRAEILSLPPEEILDNALEYAIKEDIFRKLEVYDFTSEQVVVLLNCENVLDHIAHYHMSNEDSTFENILDSIADATEPAVMESNI